MGIPLYYVHGIVFAAAALCKANKNAAFVAVRISLQLRTPKTAQRVCGGNLAAGPGLLGGAGADQAVFFRLQTF
jgi:hypothetical protein